MYDSFVLDMHGEFQDLLANFRILYDQHSPISLETLACFGAPNPKHTVCHDFQDSPHNPDRDHHILDCVLFTDTGRCDPNWHLFGDSCFYFSNIRTDWYEAIDACVLNSAQLLSIHSSEEQSFVTCKCEHI